MEGNVKDNFIVVDHHGEDGYDDDYTDSKDSSDAVKSVFEDDDEYDNNSTEIEADFDLTRSTFDDE
jgi:hypothetical protein